MDKSLIDTIKEVWNNSGIAGIIILAATGFTLKYHERIMHWIFEKYMPEKNSVQWEHLGKHPLLLMFNSSKQRVEELHIDDALMREYARKYLLARIEILEAHLRELLADTTNKDRDITELGQLFATMMMSVSADYRKRLHDEGIPLELIQAFSEFHNPRSRKLLTNMVWYSTGGFYSSPADYAWDALTMISQATLITIVDMEVVANRFINNDDRNNTFGGQP